MEEMDYYTVMEERIRYFARKYDPENKIGRISQRRKVIFEAVQPAKPLMEKRGRVRKRLLERFDSLISVFL